jgi:hypothetical protein
VPVITRRRKGSPFQTSLKAVPMKKLIHLNIPLGIRGRDWFWGLLIAAVGFALCASISLIIQRGW